MDGISGRAMGARAPLWGGARRVQLLVLAVLVVAALGLGYALWPGSPAAAGPEASGAAGANPAGEGALPVGWVDAIDECDCTFGQ